MAGKLLDNILQAIGLKRSKVYILNVLKCRPHKNRNYLFFNDIVGRRVQGFTGNGLSRNIWIFNRDKLFNQNAPLKTFQITL